MFGYADDLSSLLDSPEQIASHLHALQDIGIQSQYCINVSKCAVIPTAPTSLPIERHFLDTAILSPPPHPYLPCPELTHIPLSSHNTHLGISYGTSITPSDAFSPYITKLEARAVFYSLNSRRTLTVRIRLANERLLPIALYPAQFYKAPPSSLQRINAALKSFILPGLNSSLTLDLLRCPPSHGGLYPTLIDFEAMNDAALARVLLPIYHSLYPLHPSSYHWHPSHPFASLSSLTSRLAIAHAPIPPPLLHPYTLPPPIQAPRLPPHDTNPIIQRQVYSALLRFKDYISKGTQLLSKIMASNFDNPPPSAVPTLIANFTSLARSKHLNHAIATHRRLFCDALPLRARIPASLTSGVKICPMCLDPLSTESTYHMIHTCPPSILSLQLFRSHNPTPNDPPPHPHPRPSQILLAATSPLSPNLLVAWIDSVYFTRNTAVHRYPQSAPTTGHARITFLAHCILRRLTSILPQSAAPPPPSNFDYNPP